MDIIVEGRGQKDFKPNQVIISLSFENKDFIYERALKKGIASVNEYCKLLESMGFKKDDLKTCSFSVNENKKYDNEKKSYFNEGYVFNQSATLKFDYDMEKLAELIEITSKNKNGPSYTINFNIKEQKKVQTEMLALAYEDAKSQAEAIAKASGREIKECVKVSFEPFDTKTFSQTRYDGDVMCRASLNSVRENIINTFVPEDVTLSVTIYCQFITK